MSTREEDYQAGRITGSQFFGTTDARTNTGPVVRTGRADTQQAAPTGAGDVVLDKVLLVIDRMLVAANSGHEWASGSVLHSDELRRVRKALIDRAEFGEKKYGTKLRMLNGRDATYDLWQELLDAIMYAMQARMEGKPGRHLVELLVGLAGQIEGI